MPEQPPTKLTAPTLEGVVARARLFDQLALCLRTARIVWVQAPAGWGKTTLLASFAATLDGPVAWYRVDERDRDLPAFFAAYGRAIGALVRAQTVRLPRWGPEHANAWSGFVRHYFEAAYAALPRPATLVVDDLQLVQDEATWETLLRDGLCDPPPGVSVLIASRSSPPAALARHQVSQTMALLSVEDLAFTEDELLELLARPGDHATRAEVGRLRALTGGWVACALLARDAVVGPGRRPSPQILARSLYDYFAAEVLEGLSPALEEALTQLALAPSFDGALAEALSGTADIARWLDDLEREHRLVEKTWDGRWSYRLHDLFRAFLQQRLRARGLEATQALARRTAACLAASGQHADAVELCLAEGLHEDAARFILTVADAHLEEGSDGRLLGWLRRLPERHIAADRHLSYWFGVTLALAGDPGSLGYLRRSLGDAVAASDAVSSFRAWAGAVESLTLLGGQIHEMHRCISEHTELCARFPGELPAELTFRVAVAMLNALSYVRPSDPALGEWSERARRAWTPTASSRRSAHAAIMLANHAFSQGRPADMLAILTDMIPTPDLLAPYHRAGQHYLTALARLARGELDRARLEAAAGRTIAHKLDILLWSVLLDGVQVWCHLSAGEGAEAARGLERLTPRAAALGSLGNSLAYVTATWCALEQGRPIEAAARCDEWEASEALAEYDSLYPLLLVARAWAARDQGRLEEARRLARDALARAGEADLGLHAWVSRLAVASVALAAGDEAELRSHLTAALTFARGRGLALGLILPRRHLAELCAAALARDIEPAWVIHLVRCRELEPPAPLSALPRWPAATAVELLGPLRLTHRGEPVVLGRKPPRRTLSLLAALASVESAGATAVTLVEWLWPDADGDLAHQTLKATVHRLRQLLGGTRSVQVDVGQVRLDPSTCWVDVEALRHEASLAAREPDLALRATRAQRLLDLYRGPFAEGLPEAPWLVHARGELADLLTRTVGDVADRLDEAGRPALADELRRGARARRNASRR